MSLKRGRLIAVVVLLAAIYYCSARWGLLLAFQGTQASPVWPPSGIALGAILLFGRQVWPAITIGALAANLVSFSANQVTGMTAVAVSLSIAAGNTLEALAGFYLLRTLKIIDNPLDQPQSVFKFMMVALLMCMVSAVIGTASLVLGGTASEAIKWPIWINWWLGDVAGVLIITPLVIAWLLKRNYPGSFRLKTALQMAVVLAVFFLLIMWIFRGRFSTAHVDRLLLYLCIPFLAGIAYRFGQCGVSLASALLAVCSVWNTIHGSGPFAVGDLNNSLILLVSFIALCSVTGLILAADISQHAQFRNAPVPFKDFKLSWLILMALLGISMLAWQMVSKDTEIVARDRFDGLVSDAIGDTSERMNDYEQILRGGVGLFAVMPSVSRAQWHEYSERLDIRHTFPGMQSFAFAEWVTDKESHVQKVRKDGFPAYRIFPAGDRQAYLPVTYIEPFDWRNQRAFGYDMDSEPVRHQAIAHARDTGKMTITGKIRLTQENGRNDQSGFVMFVPVYRNGAPVSTVEERRAALLGYVCSGFRMNDLMESVLGRGAQLIALEIFDGLQVDSRARMYSNAMYPPAGPSGMQRLFVAEVPLRIADHDWLVRAVSLPAFEATIDRQKAQIILVSGFVVSLLLFILVRFLAITRESALVLADDMTAALRQSEAKLRILNSRMELATEAGGIGVWDWDIEADYLNWDNRMFEIYQLDPLSSDHGYAMWRSRVHPDDLERVETALNEARSGGKPFAAEFSIVLPSGQLHRIKANALVIRDELGSPLHMVGINIDITDLRQAEESLRASEKRFRRIFEDSPIGMAIVSLEGKWLDVNNAICEILGYSKTELAGLTFQDITFLEDLEDDLALVAQLMNGSLDSYHLEKRYIRKDGDIVWALLTVTLMRDELGNPLYFLSQIKNITDRVHAAAKLQATLALQSAILSSSNLSMIATNIDGEVVSFNRAAQRMLQYSEEEVVGQQISTLIHDMNEVASRATALSLELGRRIKPGFEVFVAKPREGYADEHEWIYIRKDGTRLPVLLSITAIRDESGEITGFLGIANDITDRKQKEQAIAAALAEKEVLLKEVYHRVKNNLQVITSLFSLQLRSLPEGAARTALKESADRVRAMALVHEKLYQSNDLSSIPLDGYLRDLCRQLGAVAAVRERDIAIEVEAVPVEIGLELAVPLGLLLNELVSNSLKHGFPDGRSGKITVRLARDLEDARIVVLEVLDNGVGLPPGLDIQACHSLGLKLVASLSHQLNGTFVIEEPSNGTLVRLTFRLDRPHTLNQEEASLKG